MTNPSNKMIEDPNPGAGTLYVHGDSITPIPVTWEEILKVSRAAAKPLFFMRDGSASAVGMIMRAQLMIDPRGTISSLDSRCIT